MTTLDIDNLKEFFKLCKKNEVQSIEYQGIRVVFLEQTNLKTPLARLNKSQEKKSLANTLAGNEKESMELSDEESENMHLEDPVEYERKIIEGELESDRSADD